MVKANANDKQTVVSILSKSFNENRSVNYVLRRDSSRESRLKKLMEYSFDYCSNFGEVFLSEDRKACALIVLPDKRKTNFKSIYLDLKLALTCVGLANLGKVMKRESKIKSLHPKTPMYYLWFIGVDPDVQNKGLGSKLLKQLIERGKELSRPIYLETSTPKNLPWYEKFGFSVYNVLDDFGYRLFCLKAEN